MGITAEQKAYLNKFMGGVAFKVQLGTLIENAESVVAGEVALADGKVLVGNASGVAAAQTLSGDVTVSNAGVTAIGANKVTAAMLATAIAPSHVVKYAGEFTTAGGDVSESIPVVGALGTDIAIVLKKSGTGVVEAAAAGADAIAVTMSADPGAATVLSYIVMRATA